MQRIKSVQWTPKRLVVLAVVTFLVMSLVAIGITTVREQAFGAQPDPVVVTPQFICPPDSPCGAGARRAVRAYHHGRLGHAQGFKPGHFFVHPKRVRTFIIRHINRYHRNHPGTGITPALRASMSDGTCGSNYGVCVYNGMKTDSKCVAVGGYPASLSGHGCDETARNHKLTNQQVGALFDYTACEGAVGVVTFYSLALPPAPVPAVVIGASGSAACSVHLWYALTFG